MRKSQFCSFLQKFGRTDGKVRERRKKKNVRRIEKVRRKTEKDRSIDFALKMFGNRFFFPCFSTKKNERKIQNCVLNFGGIAGALRLRAH